MLPAAHQQGRTAHEGHALPNLLSHHTHTLSLSHPSLSQLSLPHTHTHTHTHTHAAVEVAGHSELQRAGVRQDGRHAQRDTDTWPIAILAALQAIAAAKQLPQHLQLFLHRGALRLLPCGQTDRGRVTASSSTGSRPQQAADSSSLSSRSGSLICPAASAGSSSLDICPFICSPMASGTAAAAAAMAVAVAYGSGILALPLNAWNRRQAITACHAEPLAWAAIRAKRSARQHQPLRDELLVEIAAAARRLALPLERLSIGIVPHRDHCHAASAGSLLPGAEQFLLIPEALVLNMALSRVRHADPFDASLEVAPESYSHVLLPADRYILAHEMAHLKLNHHVKRQGTALALVSLAIASGPLAQRALPAVSRRGASVLSVLALAPAFALLQAFARHQELQADQETARCGYALGGRDFWAQQLEAEDSRHNPATEPFPWLQSHPSPSVRFELFSQALATSTPPAEAVEPG